MVGVSSLTTTSIGISHLRMLELGFEWVQVTLQTCKKVTHKESRNILIPHYQNPRYSDVPYISITAHINTSAETIN